VAYGAIPIPPGLRQVTDTVVDSVLALLEHPHNLTDVAIQVARDEVPSGLPRDVFDTLVQLIVKRVPIQKVAGGLAEHYVKQYAPGLSSVENTVERAVPGFAGAGRMIQPLHALQAFHV
jgi:hypothetical protein